MTLEASLWGVALVLAGGALVLLSGQGTRAGASIGVCVAFLAVLAFGLPAFGPLAVFVLGAGALTRLGRGTKERGGFAERNRGRRGAASAIAKLAVPAILAGLGILHVGSADRWKLAYAAALAGAFADTAATEVGPLARGGVVGLRRGTFARLAHGAPGGVSPAGLLAGVLAAALVALVACALDLLPSPRRGAVAALAGFGASVAESALAGLPLGARLGHHGRNAAVSILSAGGAIALDAAGWAGP